MSTISISEPVLADIRRVTIDRVHKTYTANVVLRSPGGAIITVQQFTFPYGVAFETTVDNFLTNNTIPDIKTKMGFA